MPNGKVANKNIEECSKETINHFEITDSEMEEESRPLGSLPLCFKSFQTLKENFHPKDLSAIIQENPAQVNSHLNQVDLIEEEFKSKIEDKAKPVGSLPLCWESFEIIKANWPPEHLSEKTQELHDNYPQHHKELVEDENKQEMKENPQDLSKDMSDDS